MTTVRMHDNLFRYILQLNKRKSRWANHAAIDLAEQGCDYKNRDSTGIG